MASCYDDLLHLVVVAVVQMEQHAKSMTSEYQQNNYCIHSSLVEVIWKVVVSHHFLFHLGVMHVGEGALVGSILDPVESWNTWSPYPRQFRVIGSGAPGLLEHIHHTCHPDH